MKKTPSTVSIFGNPDRADDALPVTLLPRLAAAFPDVTFRHDDPTALDLPQWDRWIIIDTIRGLECVRRLNVEEIAPPLTGASVHDHDLGQFLLLAKKIRPDLLVTIIGVPMNGAEEEIFNNVVSVLREVCHGKQSR